MRRLSRQLKREGRSCRRVAHQTVSAMASMLKKTKAIFMAAILAAASDAQGKARQKLGWGHTGCACLLVNGGARDGDTQLAKCLRRLTFEVIFSDRRA